MECGNIYNVNIASKYIFFIIFLLSFIILFIPYYSVICRSSDHTVGRPQAEIRTRARWPRGRYTTPRPPHLPRLLILKFSLFLLMTSFSGNISHMQKTPLCHWQCRVRLQGVINMTYAIVFPNSLTRYVTLNFNLNPWFIIQIILWKGSAIFYL